MKAEVLASQMSPAEVAARVATVKHWYHRVPVGHGILTPGVNDCVTVLELLELPPDLTGKRVLDIGARDGFFSFECERRGAEVVAIDYEPAEHTGFNVLRDLVGSSIHLTRANVYDLTSEAFGTFDVVLFLGVLYHLRDPLLAIDTVRRVCRGRLILETAVLDNHMLRPDGSSVPVAQISPELSDTPLMQFYPGRSLNNDPTNYWVPNMKCVVAMLTEADFSVGKTILNGSRGLFMATVSNNAEVQYYARLARS